MRRKIKNWVSRCSKLSLGCKLMMVLLLFTHFAFSSENAFGQQTITVQFEKQSLSEVLSVLKQKTSFEFLYNDEEIKSVTNITRSFTNASIQEVLKSCLTGTKYGFKIVDNLIVITPDDKKKDGVEKLVVRGKVVDDAGQTLPGVTILLKGTTIGVVTDIDGKFKMELPKQDSLILIFSFVGMETQNLDVNKMKDLSKEVTVRMKADVTEMDEVVVTGYGQIKKQSFTGSSVTVKKEDLLKVSQTNVIAALQTFDPSFRIATNNQWGSDPNAMPEMYIRGRSGIGVKELDPNYTTKGNLENNPNLPTFIMDGFEVDVQKVYDMDPNRIESITILKDAAATAMYGSRAANGVVVITTVAPKPGEVTVTYSLTGGVTFPDLSDYNLANAEEKLEIERLAGLYDPEEGATSISKQDSYWRRYKNIAEGADTDWISKPLRNAVTHKHSLYIEGGNSDLRYALDASFNGDNGVMKKSYRNRTGVGFSVDYRLKNFQVKNYISYGYVKAQESPYGSFSDYTTLLPYDRCFNEDGSMRKKLQFTQIKGQSALNPLYEASLHSYDYDKYDEIIDNVSVNWFINDYLSMKGQFSITKQFTKGERFVDPESNKSSTQASSNELLTGDLYVDKGERTMWDAQAFLYYQQSIAKNNINLSVGFNATSDFTESTSTHYRGFPSGEFHSSNYAAEVVDKPIKSQSQTRLFGMIASLNYTYNDIYLLDASARFDGSSEFGSNQKWAPFWSGGLGINIHNYGFMQNNGIFNQLKIRASYGQTGKVNFPSYSAITTYEAQFDEWYVTGYGVKLKALGNKDLSWEKTNTFNIGLDMQVWNERVTFSAEWYNKKTIDLITDVTVPTSSGFASYKDNMGEIRNRGYEFNIRANIIQRNDLLFALWGNFAHNKNKIVKISDALKAYNEQVDAFYNDPANNNVAEVKTKYEEGGSTTSIFAMRSLGIDPANGQELFITRNGVITHEWSGADQVIVGNTEPKGQGSFGFNASYKNFSLFASFMYEFGGQEYNSTLVSKVENADIQYSNVDKRVLTDRWQKPGDVTPLKDIKDRSTTTKPSSRFVQDNNVLSLNALTLSYDFDTQLIKKIGLNVLRLEVSTNDLLRFSSIKQERGTSYPYAKTVNFTLRASF